MVSFAVPLSINTWYHLFYPALTSPSNLPPPLLSSPASQRVLGFGYLATTPCPKRCEGATDMGPVVTRYEAAVLQHVIVYIAEDEWARQMNVSRPWDRSGKGGKRRMTKGTVQQGDARDSWVTFRKACRANHERERVSGEKGLQVKHKAVQTRNIWFFPLT